MLAPDLSSRLWNRWMVPLGHRLRARPRSHIVLLCFALILTIGVTDYAAGLAISLSPLYAGPIALAAWFLGPGIAFAIVLFSIAQWLLGEALAGQTLWLPPLINSSLRIIFYAVYVVAVSRLSRLQTSLEALAEKRALLLSQETAERERLEREMLGIAEREQRRIGQDLHDGLCQHLTGTALASQVLTERLRQGGSPEAERRSAWWTWWRKPSCWRAAWPRASIPSNSVPTG
jgi:signal transduction histidine kinase